MELQGKKGSWNLGGFAEGLYDTLPKFNSKSPWKVTETQ